MHYNHMLVSMDWLLLDRIVRPHLGGDAVLYIVLVLDISGKPVKC